MPHDELLELINQDPARPWYRIEAAAKAGTKVRAKVHIMDAIGGWFGIRASDFVREVNDLDVDEIELHLNSPGGGVWDGMAIMNALRAHRAAVEVHIDGIAASIASIIAMAGDEVVMSRGSQMMIHNASTITWGDSAQLRKDAAILDKSDENMAGIYAAKAGGEPADWRALMAAETWYNAGEAVSAGLADRTDDSEDTEAAEAKFDLSMYAYAGRAAAPAPLKREDVAHARATYPAEGFSALLRMAAGQAAPNPPATEPGYHNQKEEAVSFETLMAGLRERLGITDAEANEDAVLASIDARLTAQPATTEQPKGTVLVDEGVLTQLQADAQSGREARDQQITERRDGIIATAMSEGRITAASREAFRASLDRDEPGTVAILTSLAKNSVPVAELGTSAGGDFADAEYSRYYTTASKEA